MACCVSSSTRREAPATAATMRSWSISMSSGSTTSREMFRETRFFWPSITAVTIPPPADPSTRSSASLRCSSSCMRCTSRIIFWMFIGFSFLLHLEQASAKDIDDSLHNRIRQSAVRQGLRDRTAPLASPGLLRRDRPTGGRGRLDGDRSTGDLRGELRDQLEVRRLFDAPAKRGGALRVGEDQRSGRFDRLLGSAQAGGERGILRLEALQQPL